MSALRSLASQELTASLVDLDISYDVFSDRVRWRIKFVHTTAPTGLLRPYESTVRHTSVRHLESMDPPMDEIVAGMKSALVEIKMIQAGPIVSA